MDALIELAAGAFVFAPLVAVGLWLLALVAAFMDFDPQVESERRH